MYLRGLPGTLNGHLPHALSVVSWPSSVENIFHLTTKSINLETAESINTTLCPLKQQYVIQYRV